MGGSQIILLQAAQDQEHFEGQQANCQGGRVQEDEKEQNVGSKQIPEGSKKIRSLEANFALISAVLIFMSILPSC